MPFIVAKITEGRSSSEKKKLMKAITDATSDTLGIQPANIRVVIDEYPKEHWSVGGEALSEKQN